MQTDDKQLAALLKEGDTAALGEIIGTYTGYVKTVIRNFSRGLLSEQDIDDLCSDVFCSLWQRREKIDIKIGFRPYLSAMARNTVKDWFKTARPLFEDVLETEISSGPSVEEKAELSEMLRCVDEGLAELNEKERELFTRYYFLGETSSELARKLFISEGSVRTTLSRARKKLKDYLTERGFDYA